MTRFDTKISIEHSQGDFSHVFAMTVSAEIARKLITMAQNNEIARFSLSDHDLTYDLGVPNGYYGWVNGQFNFPNGMTIGVEVSCDNGLSAWDKGEIKLFINPEPDDADDLLDGTKELDLSMVSLNDLLNAKIGFEVLFKALKAS